MRAARLVSAWMVIAAACSRSPGEPSGGVSTPIAPTPSAIASTPPRTVTTAPPPPAPSAAASFELAPLPPSAPFGGRIDLTVSRPSLDPGPVQVVLYVGGRKARWDVAGGWRVYDGDQRRLSRVDEPAHAIHVADEASLLDAGAGAGAWSAWTITPDPTTPSSTVSGYACDRERTQDSRYIYDACLASGLPWIPLPLVSPALETVAPFAPALRERGWFPLSIVVRQVQTSGTDRMHAFVATYQVQKIDRGRVPDAAFALPAYPIRNEP